MYGAILGDIIGSPFEFDRGDKTKEFDLFSKDCDFTDDSVMTIAVGEALLAVGKEATVKEIEEAVVTNMQDRGKRYPYAGYGGRFRHWLRESNPKPYGSYGNGSAMRVSAAGWLYDSMERTREVARATANVTHNHPEGIKGAEATASAIYMARNGSSKEEIKEYIEREFHYDLSRRLDNIRPYYHHVESCQETVPEAIIAFLESKDFEDAVRNAVSLGGDTDTLGAITGSIAEAFYGIPAVLIAECKSRIDKGLMTDVLDEFDHVLGRSMDTYSDEMDETQANQMIEAAIDQYYIQQDKNGMLLFMEVMVTRMQQAGEVVVPYITENPFMSEEQISKVKAGDTISLDHDVRLKIETVKDADEKEWIGVFTSSEEMHKGSAGNVQMNQSIESILRLALNWEQVNGIVIHYTANPGSSAMANRDYFEGLKDAHTTKASSHFIVGLEGEVVQCIPTTEIAYASNDRNGDTISIECCHPDDTGAFNTVTYQSMVQLTAWLCNRFGLTSQDVIRHYDVTGKICPKYFVEHEDAWEQFKADVQQQIGVLAS